MNRRSKLALSVLGAVGLIAAVLVAGFIAYAYATNRSFEQTLATNLTVSSEWIELSPHTTLQTRRRVTEIAVALPNYRSEPGVLHEIKLADGRIIQPQIEVVAANGSVLDLQHSGFNFTGNHDLVIFTPKGGFPKGDYRSVRIRSDQPFTIERIFWRERNPK